MINDTYIFIYLALNLEFTISIYFYHVHVDVYLIFYQIANSIRCDFDN